MTVLSSSRGKAGATMKHRVAIVVSVLVVGILVFGGYAFGEGNGILLRLKDQDRTCTTTVASDQVRQQLQDRDSIELRDGSCKSEQLVAGISTQLRMRTRDRFAECDGQTLRTRNRSKAAVGRVASTCPGCTCTCGDDCLQMRTQVRAGRMIEA
jgi:hypothetical protein